MKLKNAPTSPLINIIENILNPSNPPIIEAYATETANTNIKARQKKT